MDTPTPISFNITGYKYCTCTIHSIERSVERSIGSAAYTCDPTNPNKFIIIPESYKANQSYVQTCLYVKITLSNVPMFTVESRTYSLPETLFLDCYTSTRDHFQNKHHNKPALFDKSIESLRKRCIGSDQPCFMLPAMHTDEFGRLPILIACGRMLSTDLEATLPNKVQNTTGTLEDRTNIVVDSLNSFVLHGVYNSATPGSN